MTFYSGEHDLIRHFSECSDIDCFYLVPEPQEPPQGFTVATSTAFFCCIDRAIFLEPMCQYLYFEVYLSYFVLKTYFYFRIFLFLALCSLLTRDHGTCISLSVSIGTELETCFMLIKCTHNY